MSADASLLRSNPRRAVLAPFREHRFTYREYERLLERLTDGERFRVVPLRDFPVQETKRIVVGLRHDVDNRLGSALALGRLEHRRGLASTYFMLHSASYYRHDRRFLHALRTLQDQYGHEIGFHNDLVTLQCVNGVDAVAYLHSELEWLRANGVDIVGTAAHGARECHVYGFSNRYLFTDFPETDPAFPNRHSIQVGTRQVPIPAAHLADFGLVYEATRLFPDHYFTDASFEGPRRWHPRYLPWSELRPADSAVVLVHPCLWDTSAAAKVAREGWRLSRRGVCLAITRDAAR